MLVFVQKVEMDWLQRFGFFEIFLIVDWSFRVRFWVGVLRVLEKFCLEFRRGTG
jgi:hypothetical protein